MINPQWLEPPVSRMNFHGPKDVRAIEVRLYTVEWGSLNPLIPKVNKRTKANNEDPDSVASDQGPTPSYS